MSGKAKIKVGDWYFDSAEFDAENDVLYLSMGAPRRGYGEETPEGHILRYDEEGEFCGVTLIGVQGLLDGDGPIRVTVPPKVKPNHTWLRRGDLQKVLA
jgi:uncharacterized protein YuzE